jgi:hypothetical protein
MQLPPDTPKGRGMLITGRTGPVTPPYPASQKQDF